MILDNCSFFGCVVCSIYTFLRWVQFFNDRFFFFLSLWGNPTSMQAMAARLFHIRRLLHFVRRPAFPSSAAFPPPPPYAVLGRPRRLSSQTAAAPRYDDDLISDTLFFTLLSLYFYCGARKADSWVRYETANNQRLKSKIERMDYEIRALEEVLTSLILSFSSSSFS